MINRLDNIKLNIGESEDKLIKIASKKLGQSVRYFKIIKKSLDARDKNNIKWVYSIAFSDKDENFQSVRLEKILKAPRVIIIGSGPAGLFCAVRLIEYGFEPIIIERGESVEDRVKTINKFFKSKILNPDSNVQFGEGGAGTFSDGKLNTQTHDGYNKQVLEIFNRFGAPDEIMYLNKPHIGSDNLLTVLKNLRKYVEGNGGSYMFDTLFNGIKIKNNSVYAINLKNTVNGTETEIKADCVVAALGHSSRETFRMLSEYGVAMEPRDFALGVRIEHSADEIGFAQYGLNFKQLPAADYKLVSHAHERTVFTFCMCPGGVVIPAASEEGGIVTNGMSNYKRNGENSNSALMVQLKKSDYGERLFDGMEFQRKIERRAFKISGGNYSAPVQLFDDFSKGKTSYRFGTVKSTYAVGTNFVPLDEILPKPVSDALLAAIPDFDKKLKGFANPHAVLTGVETRFSSPVRILRTADGESVSLSGFFPCGEGSGYSGGITSSAADGLHIAEKIYNKYKNH